MKFSNLFKALGLTTALAISSSTVWLANPNKSLASPESSIPNDLRQDKDQEKCIGVGGGNPYGGEIVLYTCDGTSNQAWHQSNRGELINNDDLCIGVAGGKVNDAEPFLVAFRCDGTPNQRWSYNPSTEEFRNGGNLDKCMGSFSGRTGNNTRLVLFPCNGNADQHWFGLLF